MKNKIIIIVNLSVHKTKKLMKFYNENKLNIIFNWIYISSFNVMELIFRRIKFTLYNNLYETMDNIIEDVKKYWMILK